MNCPKCNSKMKLDMIRDVTGKRYYETCTNDKCNHKIEINKLGPKKK